MAVDLPQLCALVGPNNAGKSNVLLALSRVFRRGWVNASSFDGDLDHFQRDPDRDVVIRATFDTPLEYKRFKTAPAANIHTLEFTLTRYKIGLEKGAPRVEQRCLDDQGKPVQVLAKAFKKGEQAKFEPLSGAVPREIMDLVPLIYIDTKRTLRDAMPSNRYSLLRQLMTDVDKDFNDPAQRITVDRRDGTSEEMSRAERWTQLMRAAMKLLRTPEFESLERDINASALRQLGFNPDTDTDQLRFFFGPQDTLDFYRALELQVDEGGFQIDASELGEGFQNALVLAILEAFEKRRKRGAILLIEEPEMFLHPQTQRSLFQTLKSIAETNQVIYTTHSTQMLSVPDYRNVLLVRREPTASPPDGDSDGNGKDANILSTAVVASSLDMDEPTRQKLERAFDVTRSELFFARRVLVVEGDTERLALAQWAKKVPVDLDYSCASIIEVGGKNNLLLFAEIAVSFGIPTGIIYDQDSKDIKDEENTALNERLAAFDDPSADQRSWRLDANYEDALRSALGADSYQSLCQRYPSMSKPLRQRQIAADPDTTVPDVLHEVLIWLADTVAIRSTPEPTMSAST